MANYIITNNGLINADELKHYGVLGMKWGVRRYQNPDGTLTAAGRKRYGVTTNYEKVSQKKKAMVDAKSDMASAKVRRNAARDAAKISSKNVDSIVKNWGPTGNAVRNKWYSDGVAEAKATKDYKQAKKNYKNAKKDYKSEIRKRNENYDIKSYRRDSRLLNEAARDQVNNMLNTHGDMTTKQARTTTYVQAGLNTAAFILTAYGIYKIID